MIQLQEIKVHIEGMTESIKGQHEQQLEDLFGVKIQLPKAQ